MSEALGYRPGRWLLGLDPQDSLSAASQRQLATLARVNVEQTRLVPVRVLVAIALLVMFAALGVVSHDAGSGTALDHELLGWLIAHRSAGPTAVAVAVTTAGSPPVITALAVIAGALLWWRQHAVLPALVVVGTLGAAMSVSTLTKIAVGSHRPARALQLMPELDMSYPSGHVTGTLAMAGIVAVAVGAHRGRFVRLILAIGVAAVTILIALTRLYLGVHWLTDIGGGVLLGSAAVLLGSAVPGFGANSPVSGSEPIVAKHPTPTAWMK
jgi:membrane-associated phospholipid phosphatase